MTSGSNNVQLVAENNADSKQYVHNAIELALSLGDFQKEVQSECTPQMVCSEAIERLCHLISFKASAIYLVDEETSDLRLSVCVPVSSKNSMDEELEFMIQNGSIAWAMRERRGITIHSENSSNQILLHVISTYSRTRGLFVGIFPSQSTALPDASLEITSLILRNAANCIESLLYSEMLRQQKQNLKEEVDQKTQQLIHYEKQIVQAQKTEAIAALAGGVAHQFNNSLTGLLGNLDLISMIVTEDSKILPYIERTRPIIEHMSNLTTQLLAYARGGTFTFTQAIELKDLLNQILPSTRGAIKKTVTLRVDLTDESATVDVDLIQIRTVIHAIINNADEAISGKGKIWIRSQLLPWQQIPEEISGELKLGEYVCIHIQDSGVGMDENTLRRLFEPFFSTKFEGRGLSMAAVSGIIKSHCGGISVSSQISKGTSVKIFLPRTSTN